VLTEGVWTSRLYATHKTWDLETLQVDVRYDLNGDGGLSIARIVTVPATRDDGDIPVAGEYTTDPTHTSVEFIGRHLMITKVRGRLPDVS